MDRSTATQTPDPSEPGRRSRVPAPWLLWTAVLVLLGVALVVRVVTGEPAPPPQARDGEGPGWSVERPIGEVIRLTEGAVARVNSLEPDVTLALGLPGPEPGTRLVRADVEVCAGEEERFVEPAFWVGLGDDDAVHSSHMGVRDFRTFTLPPGGCQRGYVDLALPEDVELAAVLLMDHTRTTVAAWAAEGQPGDVEPLHSGVTPQARPVGARSELLTSGTATLHDVLPDAEAGGDADGRFVRIDGEVCAGEQELLTGSGNWFLQLADHRLVPAERGTGTATPAAVTPGSCDRGTADFRVPAGATVAAVVYTFGGVYEEARWRVEG